MKSSFWLDYSLALIVAIAVPMVVAHYLERPVPASFWLAQGFIALLTIAIFRFLKAANKKRPQIFVASFMGSLTAKLLLSALLILAVGLIDRPNLKFTGLSYFGAYALFTIVEIKNLFPLLRGSNS